MKRYTFITLGIIFTIIGAIGIVLPLLPTTPFLLLASFCFSRSSERLNNYLIKNRFFGSYVENYRSGTGVTKKNKISALIFLWVILSISFFLNDNLILRSILVLVGIGVTIHLYMIKIKIED
ncbi:MAG: hypothetical protein K0S51_1857 [Bacillales bacterium]|jgi:uncharacterized membrane protein YbaN (DUF454 family)|nr:hypothetical protein [Bacillales bacterium]